MNPNTDISIVWGDIVRFAACEEPMLVMLEYLFQHYQHFVILTAYCYNNHNNNNTK